MSDRYRSGHRRHVPLVLDDLLDSLTIDGRVVRLRPLDPTDRNALHAVVDRCSDRSVFLRFFALSREAAHHHVDSLLVPGQPGRTVEVAAIDDRIVGFGSYEPVLPLRAEIAVLIDDAHHHQGIGTLLIEQLTAHARAAGLTEFVADVLGENTAMRQVLRDLGYAATIVRSGSEEELVWQLAPVADAVARSADRDRVATVNSLRALLAPSSIAVIGASERERSVGRSVFERLVADFTGRVHAVNPARATVLGYPCYPSVDALPEVPDLAVLAVPAAVAVHAARACGAAGVRGLIVLGSGFREAGADGAALEAQLLETARDHGMRLIGPNCLGVLNTNPRVRMRAALAELPGQTGAIGIAAQSGALGIAAVAELARHGTGASQFVSLGNKADVSGNDLLQWWRTDPQTSVIGLYLESFGNPTRFRRIAHEVTQHKPIVAIKAGRSTAGLRAGSSHTAAAASPDDLVDALCVQSGVARVDTLEELVAALRVLAAQPLPRGPRIAIIGNSGGPEILAADCAEHNGLIVPVLAPAVSDELRAEIPAAAAVTNPVDIGAEMTAHDLRRALMITLGSPDIDAIAVVVCETGSINADEISTALRDLPAFGKPVVAAVLGPDRAAEEPGTPPLFDYPEVAVGALATAWTAARLRGIAAAPPVSSTPSVQLRRLVERLPDGWLSGRDAERLVSAYGIPVVTQRTVTSASAAVLAVKDLGLPIVAKADGIVHKSEVGGVRLNLRNIAQVRAAASDLLTIAPRVLLQPVADGTAELLIGAIRSEQFGPAVVLAAGGTATDLIADRVVRLAPLTDVDAGQMMNSLRCRTIFDGFRGSPPVSRHAVTELLLNVSRLMTELPRIAEMDLNPVRCNGDQLVVVDVKVRLASTAAATDPLIRALNPRRTIRTENPT